MPKRVPVEAKRVPLNCLVLPQTLEWLKSAKGSQGSAVDQAVAMLMAQDAGWEMGITPVAEIATTIPTCEESCDHISCEMQREPSKAKARQVQTWKRGPRPKGDKTR